MDLRVGLCSVCARARVVISGKGSRFQLCLRSREDPTFPKYPPLPVLSCRGYEPGHPVEGAPSPSSDHQAND